MAKWGFALERHEVLEVVGECIQKNSSFPSRFKNNRPGLEWFRGLCECQKLSLQKLVSSEKTRQIATSNSFIIYGSCDAFEKEVMKLVPGKGQKTHRVVDGNMHENTTAMVCVSANGEALPLLIIFWREKLILLEG
ncbi:hypothetical protein PR048_032864 [Dryococelus australis]|uniref:Transposase n=1 Tax=Dryococelus australis TaxID=614101 RepID=A0ABQ9G4K9_9NEOP|nr:hypothetical protein PR048_032864 [Dryococelus australis]